MDKITLRRIVVYIEDEKGKFQTIELITNNLEWKASTIAELYKRRWSIEEFFRLIKQNLLVKTFIGTSENACKSQIWIAMICYLLIELIRRVICKKEHGFSHTVLIIRVCITRYTSLNYIMNNTHLAVRKARIHTKDPPNLFDYQSKNKKIIQLYLDFSNPCP